MEALKSGLSQSTNEAPMMSTPLPSPGSSKSDFEKTKEMKDDKKVNQKRRRKFKQFGSGPSDFKL